jgi:galactonate dehydratase
MREAVGPDFELLIEAHRRFAPSHAIRIGHRLREFGIRWYEEPCPPDNIELLAEVRRAVPIPIVTGEALYSKESFFHALQRRAADILNPDICAIGGISAMLDIAAMAQPQAVVMAPHNYNSVLAGFAATAHVCATIPNFLLAEYFVNFRQPCSEIARRQIEVERGWAELPTEPGLGVDIDLERLQAHPYQELGGKALTEGSEEFPRKT